MARRVYMNKKNIETLIKMENLIMLYSQEIFGEKKDKINELNWFDGEKTIITYDDYMSFNNLIENIINCHQENIKRNNTYKQEKRKENRFFARSKTEIERMKKGGKK